MSNKDIIFESTQTNIQEFIKNESTLDLIDLYFYISSSDGINRPPTELEKRFIEEFFTHHGWAEHIQEIKSPSNSFFKHRNNFDLPMITSILAFEVMRDVKTMFSAALLSSDKFRKSSERYKKEKAKLKKELEISIDNAYFDKGHFDKVDGFSNLYETLIKYNYLKEREN